MPMEIKAKVTMFGHRFTVWQGERACILQIDDVFLPADANEGGDLVLPHHLLITNNMKAAEDICKTVDDAGVSVLAAASYFASTRSPDGNN